MKYALAIAALTLLVFASPVSADGLGGQRLEKNSGNYIVDVGSDQSGSPQAGSPVQFDFSLLKNGTRDVLPFKDVVVTFAQNGVTTLDSDLLYAQGGSAYLTYLFPQGGAYDLKVTFYDDQGVGIAQSNFALQIGGQEHGGVTSQPIGAGLVVISLVCGIGIGALGVGSWMLRDKKKMT